MLPRCESSLLIKVMQSIFVLSGVESRLGRLELNFVYRGNAVHICFIGCESSLFIEVMHCIFVLSGAILVKQSIFVLSGATLGVCENLLVKINKFIFPVDFVVLEMDNDESVPIILGRPFLVTARAVIDVHDERISLRVGKETWMDTVYLDGKCVKTDQNYEKDQAVFFHPRHEVEPLERRAPENHLKQSIKEPPKLELKELPEHLEYAFLQGDDQLPVVISSSLSKDEKTKLLNVLRNHKEAIAWSGLRELHQLDTFYNSLNSNDQDALESAAGGNLLDKMPQEGLAIIERKSKVRYSRSRASDSRVSTDAPLSNSSPSNNSFDMQQIAASLEDKMTIKMNKMLNEMKALVVTTPAPVKAVEEVCVTCGSNHNFNHCPLTQGRNDFPVFQDNIQQFQQTAAVGNFLQRNQPSNLASQMRPPGFNQPNVQNNQNRYQGTNSNFNQNRPNNQGAVYQAPPYQPPTQPLVNQALPPVSQTQGVSKTDFESYSKANDANMNNLQMKLDNFQNDFQRVYNESQKKQDDFQKMMLGFMQ
ncbi:reverse transcriptase domain-containing protein, partial [Tanacetum coccineum]